ncbi:hypothetical protein [Zavarzinella formosa]|uniref:hypothetical protein n=1 Tax=Zavarzinella formosa TaxID=360055 RepID=UPI000367279D|nr:hypothetical protein [Zavarzinella formosa]
MTFANAMTITYQDIDGDDIKVSFSKPILNTANVNTVFAFDTGSNTSKQQLQTIDLRRDLESGIACKAKPMSAVGNCVGGRQAPPPLHAAMSD